MEANLDPVSLEDKASHFKFSFCPSLGSYMHIVVNFHHSLIICIFKLRDLFNVISLIATRCGLHIIELSLMIVVISLEFFYCIAGTETEPFIISDEGNMFMNMSTIHELFWKGTQLTFIQSPLDKKSKLKVKEDKGGLMASITEGFQLQNDKKNPVVELSQELLPVHQSPSSSIYEGSDLEPDRLLRYKHKFKSAGIFNSNK